MILLSNQLSMTLHLKNLYEIWDGCTFSVYLHCFGIQDLPFWFGTCFGVILVVLNLLMLLKLLQIAEDYSHCEFLIRLPGYCPSMLVLTQPQDESPCVSFLISISGAGTLFGCSQNINLVLFCFQCLLFGMLLMYLLLWGGCTKPARRFGFWTLLKPFFISFRCWSKSSIFLT